MAEFMRGHVLDVVPAASTNGTSVAANGRNEVFFRPDTGSAAIATTYWWTDGSNHVIDADVVFYDGSYLSPALAAEIQKAKAEL